ncbi:hypothetical protein BN3590_00870 [Clostridium sp. C105KSO15]|nr:hypothetical protein BN3590_00870 [Clostridium sp. C105KSO15]
MSKNLFEKLNEFLANLQVMYIKLITFTGM